MDVFKTYATDEKAEVEGRWVEIGEGAKLLIARADNENYRKEFMKMWEANKPALDAGGDAADKLAQEMFIEVEAKTILKGWEGIQFKGKSLDYSMDNAKKVLSLRDFRALVARLAQDAEAYRAKLEEEQGND